MQELIQKVREELKPEPRANATASTLGQLLNIAGAGQLGDIAAAWSVLSTPREGDDGPTKGRRATCGELAGLVPGGGFPNQAIPIWEAWVKNFSGSDDPRQAAMERTFSRELAELREIA